MRWLLALVPLVVVGCSQPPSDTLDPRAFPLPAIPRAHRPELPQGFIPIGSQERALYAQLTPLNGFNLEQIIRFRGAVNGLPPSYYDPDSGLLIGFAWWPGVGRKEHHYIPLSAGLRSRVLVLVRNQPLRDGNDMGYLNPEVVRRVAYRLNPAGLVTQRVVKALGVNLGAYSVVTMHRNGCAKPTAVRERSGLYASKRGITPFNWRRRQRATKQQLLAQCPKDGVLLCGDGGSTITYPGPAPKIGLLFFRWPEEQANRPKRLDGPS